MNITHDEWQAELSRSQTYDEPAGAKTLVELMEHLSITRYAANLMIHRGLASKRISRVYVHRKDSSGKFQRVVAYVIQKEIGNATKA